MSAEPIGAAVLEDIKSLLGPYGYIDDPSRMQPHLASARDDREGKSPLIALPSDTAQVSALVKLCRGHRIPMVPQGGNTGLVSGGIPSDRGDEIVINLARMNKIRAFDPTGSLVTVEAGVILQKLQEEAEKAGFLFPLSMASEGSAQIGGAISTNAGGTAVLRYGNMRELVVGLEAVLPDGEILDGLKSLPKDNTGYNLNHWFIGAEGTLGIVTAATLKLFPRLNQTVIGIAAVPTPAAAMDLLHRFRMTCGEHLEAFEIMALAALKLVVKNVPGARFPGSDSAPYYVLIELGSSAVSTPLREIFEETIAYAMDDKKVIDAVVAENSTQENQFWALRDDISEALRREHTRMHFDISLPLACIAGFLDHTASLVKSAAHSVVLTPFGHIGDGNLHYNMYFTGISDSGFPQVKDRVQKIVYGEVARLNGSISAEHGIGLERKAEFKLYKSQAALGLMRKIKRVLDPEGLMNPDKIFDRSEIHGKA